MATEPADIPHGMRRVYRWFERWRSAHTGRLPIPEPLWASAAEVVREHGVFHTAKVLRLEYGKLKRMVPSARSMAKVATPAFVELVAPQAVGLSECLIDRDEKRQLGKSREAGLGRCLDLDGDDDCFTLPVITKQAQKAISASVRAVRAFLPRWPWLTIDCTCRSLFMVIRVAPVEHSCELWT